MSTKSSKTNPEIVDNLTLWILLDHARNAIARSRELELSQFDLSPEQQIVLHTLWSIGGTATNAEIAESTIRQYNSVTTLVNRMESAGLVVKQKSPHDKKFLISITEKGRKAYSLTTRRCIDLAFSDLTPDEKNNLANYLHHLEEKGRQMLGLNIKLPFLQ